MHMLFSRAKLVPALLLLAALTACGSGHDDDDDNNGTPETTNPAPGNGDDTPAEPVLRCAP